MYRTGRDGIPGAPGKDGQPGAPGSRGPPGVAGTSGTTQNIGSGERGREEHQVGEAKREQVESLVCLGILELCIPGGAVEIVLTAQRIFMRVGQHNHGLFQRTIIAPGSFEIHEVQILSHTEAVCSCSTHSDKKCCLNPYKMRNLSFN